MTSNSPKSEVFLVRREALKQRINIKDAARDGEPERRGFFHDVYEGAGDDPAAVPWADLEPKAELVEWLANNKTSDGGITDGGGSGVRSLATDGGIKDGGGSRVRSLAIDGGAMKAIDIACGLGDHANLLAESGYETIGFDLVPKSIEWARARFPNSKARFEVADLFDLPNEWQGRFDLVYECYTIQALAPEIQLKAAKAIASLVAKNGILLNYTRVRQDGHAPKGPPFPLPPSIADCFADMGFELKSRKAFDLVKADGRKIPHHFDEWVKR